MADSKTFSGFPVQNLSSDSTSVGQIYYNTSSGSFKAVKDGGAPLGTWASGGALNTTRYEMTGLGIQTAALGVGGTEPPGTRTTKNEEYNGTAWTEKADLNSGRTAMGASQRGTITAGLVFGGATSGGEVALSESWNGSSWTETNDLNTAAYRCAGAGTLTAALRIGGNIPPATANTEKFDGTSWTEVNDLSTARQTLAGGGTQSSAFAAGGTTPPGTVYGKTETFDGTSWTENSALNTARFSLGGNAADSTAAIVYGGTPPITSKTEFWNGSSWTEVSDMGTARSDVGSAGASSSSGLAFGGKEPSASNKTEEWTAAAFEVKTLTTS